MNTLSFSKDVLEDFNSPSTSAINFMTVMARYRQNAFMQVLALANNVLQKFNESPAEAKDPRGKDGALVMIGAMAPLILRKVWSVLKAHFAVKWSIIMRVGGIATNNLLMQILLNNSVEGVCFPDGAILC